MSQKNKRTKPMIEYILPRLEAGGQKFEPGRDNIENVGIVNYLKSDNKRIFLIDREYTKKQYDLLLRIATGETEYHGFRHAYEFASIFFKDGIMYFRSAAFGEKAGIVGIKYKQTEHRTLKDYTDDEVRRMMLLAPAELIELNCRNKILYYQPKSERLDELLVKYKFTPVHYHPEIRDNTSFTSKDKISKEIYMNKLVGKFSERIKLERGQIVDSDPPGTDIQSDFIQGELF